MSVLIKIKKANATAAPPEKAQADAVPVPLPQRFKQQPGVAKDWESKRTLGRPRNQFAKHHLQAHPVEDFVNACLQPDVRYAEFIGEPRPRAVKTVDGRSAKILTEYHRLTLTQAYLQYAVDNGYLSTVPISLGSRIIKACLENGWAVRYARAGDSRRTMIEGIWIKGQEPFLGNDRGMFKPDRQRWKRKSDAA